MKAKSPSEYGFDAERYRQVDDELKRAEAYFTRLHAEIEAKAASPNGYPAIPAEQVVKAIQRLRFELRQEQERRASHRRP